MAVESEPFREVSQVHPTLINNKEQDPFTFLEYVRQFPGTKEFVYLVSAYKGDRQSAYNPYNLKIVDFFAIDLKSTEGYYTMSAQVQS